MQHILVILGAWNELCNIYLFRTYDKPHEGTFVNHAACDVFSRGMILQLSLRVG